jgi:regulatory protein
MRIRRDMQLKGVPEEAVVATLANLKHSEADAAKQVWQSKYQQAPQSTGERQKQMRFLLGRGFNMAVVNQLLRELRAHAESDR